MVTLGDKFWQSKPFWQFVKVSQRSEEKKVGEKLCWKETILHLQPQKVLHSHLGMWALNLVIKGERADFGVPIIKNQVTPKKSVGSYMESLQTGSLQQLPFSTSKLPSFIPTLQEASIGASTGLLPSIPVPLRSRVYFLRDTAIPF